ncbi:MAG TPA: amidohydrolase family protein [Longimicrobiaceae bacterium]|nr:amidohydrolase family protein [Longimicrobiaceae bacterium]
MIIDCHTHLNRYTPDLPATLAERHARLKAEMRAHGVGYALVLSSYDVTEERPSTETVLELIEDDPQLGMVAGLSTQRLGARDLAEVRGLLETGRIKALKLYPGYEAFYVHEPRLHPVYELARAFNVPVMIHTGDTFSPDVSVKYAHPLSVDEAAIAFPDVTFLICHLGNPWFADAMEVIYKNANVVGDISGLTLGAFEPRFERFALHWVNQVIAFVNDPRKLLFGTDWPISDIGSYLRFVERLELTPEEREGLLWRNAARVFRLEMAGEGG